MIVLWIVGSLVLFIVLLLAVPLAVVYERPAEGDPVKIEVSWLYGVVHIRLTGRRPRPGPEKEERRDAAEGEEKKRKKKFSLPDDVSAAVRAFGHLVRRIIGAIELSLQGDLFLGLANPADTGAVWGMSLPLIMWIEERTDLHIYPHFFGLRCDYIGRGRVGMVPLRVVIPVIAFVVSTQGRALLRAFRSSS